MASWRRKRAWYQKNQARIGHIQIKPKDLAFEGGKFEERVEWVLRRMCHRGELYSVTHHPHNSFEDRQGKDFTIDKVIDGKVITKSFGVTISLSRLSRAEWKHPNVPQRHIPLWATDQAIEATVTALFTKTEDAQPIITSAVIA